jgi:regulator of nonsense transcripts 2
VETSNIEHQIARGELSDEREERYQKALKAYERLLANTQILSQGLGLPMPDLPTLENKDTIEVGIGQGAKDKDEVYTADITFIYVRRLNISFRALAI